MINGELIVDNFAGGGGASPRTANTSARQREENQRIRISVVLHG